MVEKPLNFLPIDPECTLSLAYINSVKRPAMEMLWRLDARLAQVVRTTREPMAGRIRLAWWRDAITAMETGKEPPKEPLLQALHATLFAENLATKGLGDLAEGWSCLLDPLPLEPTELANYAALRGGTLFTQAAAILGPLANDQVIAAGKGWALVDFAFHCTDAKTRETALALAQPLLENAFRMRWPVALRPMGMLAKLAANDARQPDSGIQLRPNRQGAPRRMLSMLFHRITGR